MPYYGSEKPLSYQKPRSRFAMLHSWVKPDALMRSNPPKFTGQYRTIGKVKYYIFSDGSHRKHVNADQ